MNKLKAMDPIPDDYRFQVISKIEKLNERIDTIKAKANRSERSVVCYELKWLLGNYKFTQIYACGLVKDVYRLKNIEQLVDFYEWLEGWEYFFEKD